MRCFGVVRCIFVLLNMLINALLQSVLITITVIEVPGLEFFFNYFFIIEAQGLTHRVN